MQELVSHSKKWNWKVNGRLFGFGSSPDIDWKIILVTTIAFIILVVVSSIFLFVKVDKGSIFRVATVEQESATLNVTLLKHVVSYYQNKALEFERLKGSVVPSIDPSLQ
jgi:hypothetical protein